MNSNFSFNKILRISLIFIVALTSAFTLLAQNPIVVENSLPGSSPTVWDANDNGNIDGFAQEFSVNKGDTVHFKIDVTSAVPLAYTVKIYRLGYYNDSGARFIADLGNSFTGSSQPAPNYDAATGKFDCNNWSVSASWPVPATAVSGVYIARLNCPALLSSRTSILMFVVRDDNANSPVLFKTSDATWQAYNTFGGNTFYGASTPVPGFSHATKVSYQRPMILRGDKSSFFNAEYPMIRWLEKNGYNVTYATDMDMARDASIFTPSFHQVLLSVGHDEYWSVEQRTKFENARANGVHLAFFSGNEVYWKTRWEDNFQTLVCYKEGTKGELACGSKCDPLPTVWTGLWRDGCTPTYAANDGCRPEGALSGQMSWAQSTGSIKVPDYYKNLRFWKNTSIASLGTGQIKTLPYGTLGNEWDPEQFVESFPSHRIIFSNTLQAGLTHKLALYKHSSGSLVFSAGTMQWAWGLDSLHDNGNLPPSADMQQATVNLLHDMGITAGSLQANLVAPTIATDVSAPTSTINSPAHNSSISGAIVTITGTSTDNGSGAVAGVEVSVDNGATWQMATGLENWTFSYAPTGYGIITIKVRAWDDLGNLEIPGAPGTSNCINISLAGPFLHSVFNATYPAISPTFVTGSARELGMKFRSTVNGTIKGFRYYKIPGVTGGHVGHLWDNNGNLLATQAFTNETPLGWQSVDLTTPYSISANTTYIVSYFTPTGEHIVQDPFFTQPVVNSFLRGLANGESGGNGVYIISPTPAFPVNTVNSSNYFADVLFESADITAPQVVSTIPANSSSGQLLNIHPTITFDEPIDSGTVTSSSVIMTKPGNIVIPGTLSVSGSVITFTPNSDLEISTTYTITLKGGLSEPLIKDLSGNALASDFVFSFTTGALTATVITRQPSSQSTCANSSVSFISAATGIETPTVQWQISTDNGNNWFNISGANADTLTFTALLADNNNQYRAVWTNSVNTVNSNPAVLTVFGTITGSINAVNASICIGAPMQLQLTSATGPAPYSLVINSNTYPGINVGVPFRPISNSETIWGNFSAIQTPVVADASSIEIGVKFKTNKDGVIRGVRFYKGSTANGGIHLGSLWSQSGTLLATATFTSETNSGWQEVLFSNPVNVTANTTYVASCFLPQGGYSRNSPYFTTSFSNGNSLTALKDTVTEHNGVYAYSLASTFPNQNFGNPNYWVDVIFAPYLTTGGTFNLTTITANNSCSFSASPISSATITFLPDASAGTISGTSPLCIGATATYTSNGDAGGSWSSTNTSVATVNATTGLVTAIAAGTTTIKYIVTAGCNYPDTALFTLTVSPNSNAGTVSGTSPLCIGATATYSSNGDPGGSWSSSNTGVATVNPSSGVVSAVSNGTANIIYTVGCNATASKTLTVNPNSNAGTISGTTPLCDDSTASFSSDGDPGGTWSSSNVGVATVNPTTGVVTAVSPGSANIIYTVGCNASSSLGITVTPNLFPGTVSGSSPICIGATATYTRSGDPGGTWSSTNTAVATVNSTTGVVTALSAGSTNITYTLNTGCNTPVSSFATLTVSPDVSAGTISGTSPLCIGATSTYSSNGTAGGSWSSTNPGVATVNATSGLVTAAGSGTTTIKYIVSTGCNNPDTAVFALTVDLNANAGSVSGTSPLCIGATANYSSNGNAGGSWSSTNATVATVNATTGVVTALSAGTTNITYTLNTGCNNPVSAISTLTVSPNATAGSVSGTSPICIGATATYSSNGDTGGSWSSTNTAVATVNSTTGLVTALSAGTTNITYTLSTGCNLPASSFTSLTVNPDVSAGAITGTSPLCIGATSTYSSNGTTGGSWSSTNPGVATVNATSGLVTAAGSGTTTIKFIISTGCNNPDTAFFALTVDLNANAGSVSGTSPLCIGASATYSSNGNTGGSWSSTNTAVATVNSTTGAVTALSAGTTNITYTLTSGCNNPVSAFSALTVSPDATAGTVSGTSPLCIGATANFSSNGNAGGAWSSTNTGVATVNAATGLVTAVSSGTATIRYIVSAGCNNPDTAVYSLVVNPDATAGSVTGASPLCVGASTNYSSNGDAGGTWSSSNTAVATVNASSGVVTAVSGGNANITYTVNAGCNNPVSNSATVTVNTAISGSISAVNPNICLGSPMELQLTAATGPSPFSLVINSINYPGINVGVPFRPVAASETIWPNSTTPEIPVQPDLNSVELGVKFKTNKDGIIQGIRFYKGSTANGGTHVGSLWSQSGTLLGSAIFTNETASGWQEVLFASPVSVTANTTYLASYFAPQGRYSKNGSYFLTSHSNGNSLTALNNTVTEPNGVYMYTGTSAFPVDNFGDPNYWVDVIFAPYLAASTTFDLTSISASNGCSVSGSPLSSTSITFLPDATAGNISGTSPLCIGATATYSSNGDAGGTWSSTNTAVATVNSSSGFVTATGAGTTTIRYIVSTGCNNPDTATSTLTVSPNANAGTVSGTSPLCIGSTATFTASGDAGGSWSSSNTAVATVNPATGFVSAVSNGTTNIIYTVGCNATALKALTVSPNGNAGTVSGTTPLCDDSTAVFTSNGNSGGSWSSSNTAVATVNPSSGLVTAVTPGSADIIYTVGCNATSTLILTVNPNLFSGTVSGTSPLCIGATANYSSSGSAGGNWSSSNTSVATVNSVTGVVTAVGPGTANIIYTLSTGCNTPRSSLKLLTVTPNPNAGTVSGTSPLCIGATENYSSSGNAGGSWSSANTAVATVNAGTGVVTATGAGSTTIRYVVNNGCSTPDTANYVLTVSPNANPGAVSGTSPLCVESFATYSSNGAAGGTWSSSNTGVATADPSTGLVTAVGTGTTNITYTVNTGCNSPISSFLALTVNTLPTGNMTAVNANICAGSPMQLVLSSASGPSPYSLVINSNTYTGITVGVPFRPVLSSETIWPNSTLPEIPVQADNNAVELGVKFKTNKDGVIQGIRFYKGSTANGGTHRGSLWSQSGTLLGTAIFTNETASGWQEVLFSSPVNVNANTTYVASYFAPLGNYSKNGSYFLISHSNGNSLTALNNTVAEPNAVYRYTASSAFPNSNAGDPNYWVDVIFAPYTATTTTFNLTTITSNAGCSASESPISSATITVSTPALAGIPGGPMVCSNAVVQPAGTYYSDGSCKSIATVKPSGLVPVSGNVNSCVTVDNTVMTSFGKPYVQRHYDIIPSVNAANVTATLTLYYTQAEFNAYNLVRGPYPALPTSGSDVAGIANLLVTQYHGTGTFPGNYTGSSVLINPDDNNIFWNSVLNRWEVTFDVNGFSGFYVFTNLSSTPLPISLLNFNGRNNGNRNLLEWVTSSEQNSSYFDLLRSIDGINFVKAARIQAAGNSNSSRNYQFSDDISSFNSKLYYYKLKLVDISGQEKYSPIVRISLNAKGFNVEVSPNPFVDQLRVQVDVGQNEQALITLNGPDGKKVLQQAASLNRGSNAILIDKLEKLPAGIYLLTVNTGTDKASIKVIKY